METAATYPLTSEMEIVTPLDDLVAAHNELAEAHGELKRRHHQLCVALMTAISNGERGQHLLEIINSDMQDMALVVRNPTEQKDHMAEDRTMTGRHTKAIMSDSLARISQAADGIADCEWVAHQSLVWCLVEEIRAELKTLNALAEEGSR